MRHKLWVAFNFAVSITAMVFAIHYLDSGYCYSGAVLLLCGVALAVVTLVGERSSEKPKSEEGRSEHELGV